MKGLIRLRNIYGEAHAVDPRERHAPLSWCFNTLVILLGSALTVSAQDCWTNTAGHAFSAQLGEVSDSHAFFIMSDGTTNRLALPALSPESESRVRALSVMPIVPDRLKPVYDKCRRDLKRLDGLLADKRVDRDEYAALREKILYAFRGMCHNYSIDESDSFLLEKRLLSGR